MSSNKKDDKNEPKSFDDVLNSILEEMDNVLNIKSDDIPNIDLYMDQVLSFLDDKLNYTRRSTQDGEEKIFTKTMINNYAKNDLLPSPVKKKYSKEHMMTLIFIYYLKSFLSINDVYTLINPITEDYFNGKGSINFEDVYDYILDVGEQRIGLLRKDIQEKYKASLESFSDVEGEEGEYLRLFLLISLLSYDIFIKKMLVEQLIDEIRITQKEKVEENSKSDKKKGK
ncbi:MAG: DUF1836 domain-containing protein [Lachnospiraceae bacterium]|nr:DUF1836 domain-containing protein [Lachnospiraceae bacterium]